MLDELHSKTSLKFKKRISGQHKIIIRSCYQIDSIQTLNGHIYEALKSNLMLTFININIDHSGEFMFYVVKWSLLKIL